MANATWSKLKDGSWGVRGEALLPGSSVTVTRKDGSKSVVVVGSIVWADPNSTLVLATVETAPSKPKSNPQAAPAPRRSNPRRGWRPCGYPGCNPNYCDECDGEGYRNGR